jgi:type IV secretory pathway VirB3-like protein
VTIAKIATRLTRPAILVGLLMAVMVWLVIALGLVIALALRGLLAR